MLGKCFCLKVEKTIILIKVSIQYEEMQDFECFLQNYGCENNEVQTFLIKNNKHYLFLRK